jgi:ribonuclease BN (tRNA processing enzyme)
VKLEILGCATPFPRRDNPCSGYLLSGDESTVLLDCGSGIFAALLEVMSPNELSGVWISHMHPDHFADLPALANWALNTPDARKLRVFGPHGWDRRLNFFLSGEATSDLSEKIFEVNYIENGDSPELGGLRFHSRMVHHSVTGYGVRVSNGRTSFAYSGDTGPCESLSKLAANVDLFLCEAGSESPAEYHLTAQQAYQIAVEAGARELVLTHIPGGPASVDIDASDSIAIGIAQPGERWLIGSD